MIADFLGMGGHAAFVWPCYLLSVGGMAWLGIASWRRARRAAMRLERLSGARGKTGGKTDDGGKTNAA